MTPGLYIPRDNKVVLLELDDQITWINNSLKIIEDLKQKIAEEYKDKDRYMSVQIYRETSEVSPVNYIVKSKYPWWMSFGWYVIGMFLYYDTLFIMIRRFSLDYVKLTI